MLYQDYELSIIITSDTEGIYIMCQIGKLYRDATQTQLISKFCSEYSHF